MIYIPVCPSICKTYRKTRNFDEYKFWQIWRIRVKSPTFKVKPPSKNIKQNKCFYQHFTKVSFVKILWIRFPQSLTMPKLPVLWYICTYDKLQPFSVHIIIILFLLPSYHAWVKTSLVHTSNLPLYMFITFFRKSINN